MSDDPWYLLSPTFTKLWVSACVVFMALRGITDALASYRATDFWFAIYNLAPAIVATPVLMRIWRAKL